MHKIAIAVFFLTMTVHALGQTLPPVPSGWTSLPANGAIALQSSGGTSSPSIAIAILPPVHPQGDVKLWFGKQIIGMSQASGNVLGSSEIMEKEETLVQLVQIENKNHVKLRDVFFGYPTANGISLAVLSIPTQVADNDSRVEVANHYIHELIAKKFEVPNAQISAPPQSAPPAHGQYIGPYGRSDIDLTYHAKGIIPKERDVPLTGTYVFVGYAFGASYGGVGTTMSWGQHAVQQLLLLFGNGVAAKTDLRGGNLAGKYQAEGFATMDVADPSAVSGAPFGRWSEDGSGIHIKWNIGAPTDLTKNGGNLEGKGEKWTPFQLADGDHLEGTFMRKMEAGLRSQAIVLHQDGTFTGDGVNVTMGGSIVSPAFPERGGGHYAVHKGSMILYFSNGFTQAIACIIDKSGDGIAKTILLNGFPFERVR